MALHENYIVRVTAGPTYDISKHHEVAVNTEKPVSFTSSDISADIYIRIKDYRGLPKNSPTTSPYFAHAPHTYDRYSIAFTFRLSADLSGDDLVFGNDFDHPIRDRLPPLFDRAFGVVKWWIDPGLYGDVQADEPYLYGPLLSSINVLDIGGKGGEEHVETNEDNKPPATQNNDAVLFTEGSHSSGAAPRTSQNIPAASAARQKFFLDEAHRKAFTFEAGREYRCDFFNPYLDFNEFALKLGYGLPPISMMGHWDGQPLRYVLKNRATGKELFVVVISLLPTEQAKKEGVQTEEEKLESVHEEVKGGKDGNRSNDDDELD